MHVLPHGGLGLGGIDEARNNLSKIVNPEVRDVLGSVPLQSVLSEDRVALMNKIRDNARAKAATLGIDVIDVRLTRTDLPQQNLDATYSRMQAERQRDATDEIVSQVGVSIAGLLIMSAAAYGAAWYKRGPAIEDAA